MAEASYDCRYHLDDEEIEKLETSLEVYESVVKGPHRCVMSLFEDVRVDDRSLRILPLIMMLERYHSKRYHWKMYRSFEMWRLDGQGQRLKFPPTPLVEYERIYEETNRDDQVLAEQTEVAHYHKMSQALNTICKGCQKLRVMKESPDLTTVWKSFHHWRLWASSCGEVNRVVPLSLRVLLMLHHHALWKVFCSYSSKGRMLSNSLVRSTEMAVVLGGSSAFSPSPLELPQSPPILRAFSNDAISPVAPRSPAISFVPCKAYFKRVLHHDEAWALLRDCGLAPLHIGRRKFEQIMCAIQQQNPADSIHASINSTRSSGAVYYNHSPTKSPVKSPSKDSPPGRSALAHQRGPPLALVHVDSGVSSSSSVKKASAGKEAPGEAAADQHVSYDAFIKLLWMLVVDLMGITEDNIMPLIPTFRSTFKALENKSMALSLRTITMGGWNKYISQYTSKHS